MVLLLQFSTCGIGSWFNEKYIKYITYPLKFLDHFKVRSKVLARGKSVPLKLKPTAP